LDDTKNVSNFDYNNSNTIATTIPRGNNVTSSALFREQDLHRIAGVRQLETLERIEEGIQAIDNNDLLLQPTIIDETYIPIVGTGR
jgi:hypothetical protein